MPGNRKDVANRIRTEQRSRYANRFTRDWWRGRVDINSRYWRFHRHWGRYPVRHWWRPATWGALTGWLAATWARPVYYNYGSNVYYEGDNVYYGDEQIATAEQYFDQAQAIAAGVPEVAEEQVEWLPLGVFALANDESGQTNMLLQLAVSKEGVIAGTYYNETTNSTTPVEGMVDKKTQRAVWRFVDGTNPDVVMETGIYNLTEDEAPLLIHFGAERTQQWLLVRLEEPPAEGETGAAPAGN